jgi:large subunit ribosomal protein L19e
MKLDSKKRLAADALGVGVNRIWIDPKRSVDVSSAITREDIRKLIRQGVIRAKQKAGISRGRTRVASSKRKLGRRRGHGSRKGTSEARSPGKGRWIRTVRPMRQMLSQLRKEGVLSRTDYRKIYRMVKGGAFKSRAHLEAHLRERGIIR